MNKVRDDASYIRKLLNEQFSQFSEPDLIEELIQFSQIKSFENGENIIDYGSYIKAVPLVIQGSVKVMREAEDRGELLLYFLRAGDTCSVSFSCCMREKQSSIRAVAEDDTSIISVPLAYVNQWMGKYVTWRNFVMTSYDFRIMELVKTIDSIAFEKLDQRLLAYLHKKGEALQSTSIHITHQEIAHDLNASREATSRLLKQLEKMGRIHLGRNNIEIL